MSLTHAVSAVDSAWTSHPVSEELREKVRLSTYLSIITCQSPGALGELEGGRNSKLKFIINLNLKLFFMHKSSISFCCQKWFLPPSNYFSCGPYLDTGVVCVPVIMVYWVPPPVSLYRHFWPQGSLSQFSAVTGQISTFGGNLKNESK